MGKVDVVEKDGKKYIDGEEVLLSIKYNLLGRLLLILFSWFGLAVSIFLIVANDINILLKIIAILILVQNLWLFFDVLFFKEMKITKKTVAKVWLFGKLSVPVKEIDYAYRSFYTINRGKLVFQSFKSKKKNFFFYNCMAVHLLGISNYKQVMLQIKKILIEKNIIKGDEYEWNY